MYPPGSGFNGLPQLVKPGDKLFVEESFPSSDNASERSSIASVQTFKTPLEDEKLQELSHKNFSLDTMKKVKWVLKMYCEWR